MQVTGKTNARKLIILVVILLIIALAIGLFILSKKKVRRAPDSPLTKYENGMKAEFGDYLELCEWEEEDIDIIVFGIRLDDSEEGLFPLYYIEDEEVMEEIMDLLKNRPYMGADYTIRDEFETDKWKIKLIDAEHEYCIEYSGYTNDIGECFKIDDDGFWTSRKEPHYNFSSVAGSYLINYGSDIYNGLLDLYEEYVDEISFPDLRKIKSNNSMEYSDYFKYRYNGFHLRQFNYEVTNKWETVHVYEFPIKNSDYMLEVDRFFEISESYDHKYTRINIHEIRIVNPEGESLNLHSCTDEEFEEFIKDAYIDRGLFGK